MEAEDAGGAVVEAAVEAAVAAEEAAVDAAEVEELEEAAAEEVDAAAADDDKVNEDASPVVPPTGPPGGVWLVPEATPAAAAAYAAQVCEPYNKSVPKGLYRWIDSKHHPTLTMIVKRAVKELGSRFIDQIHKMWFRTEPRKYLSIRHARRCEFRRHN